MRLPWIRHAPLLAACLTGMLPGLLWAQVNVVRPQNPAAQPGVATAAPNPLMQLMLSQAPVDVDSPVVAKAVLDPPVILVGEKAIYRLSLNALEASLRWTQQVAVPPGLKMTPSAQAQMLQPNMGVLRPLTAINFHLSAERPGYYTIPAYTLEVYGKPVTVEAVVLEVAPLLEADHARARQLLLEPARTNVFVGESFHVRVISPVNGANGFEPLNQLRFDGDGFLEDQTIFGQRIGPMLVGGKQVPAWMVESSVTAVAAGTQSLAAHAFTIEMQRVVTQQGQIVVQGGQPQYTLLDSEPLALEVRPLPPEGVPVGYNGFIGNLSLDRAQLSTNSLRVGDAIRMVATFRSDNRLTRLVPPPPPRVPGWQIFPATPAEPLTPGARVVNPALTYTATYAYTLIPMSEEPRQTPAIPFGSFDPEKGAYVDLTIPSQPVTISAEGLPADWKAYDYADDPKAPPKPVLGNVAETPGKALAALWPVQMRPGFYLAQLVPVLGLFGLWWWDRRRRFLEAHPEVVRRRAARRALLRERKAIRHAAAKGDAPGFLRHAVTALQIAAAPHFPAEPRALVCGEVLSLFEETERRERTGEVIRSLFTDEETMSFAARGEPPSPLFALQPDLEGILEKMEARL